MSPALAATLGVVFLVGGFALLFGVFCAIMMIVDRLVSDPWARFTWYGVGMLVALLPLVWLSLYFDEDNPGRKRAGQRERACECAP